MRLSYDDVDARADDLVAAAKRVIRQQAAGGPYATDSIAHAWIVRCLVDYGERYLRVGWGDHYGTVTIIDEAALSRAVHEILARVPELDRQYARWSDDGLRAAECVCVLVHGTILGLLGWHIGANSPFRSASSSMALGLAKRLRSAAVHFVAHEWSGKNAHDARTRAAQDLDLKLRRLRQERPGARVVLVAHSHGGNVARCAVRTSEVATGVARIVCLATPFVIPSERDRFVERVEGWRLALSALWCTVITLLGFEFGWWLLWMALPAGLYLAGSATVGPVLPLNPRERQGGYGIGPAFTEAIELARMINYSVKPATVYMRDRLMGGPAGPELCVATVRWDEPRNWLRLLAMPWTALVWGLVPLQLLGELAWIAFRFAAVLVIPAFAFLSYSPTPARITLYALLISGTITFAGPGSAMLLQAIANLLTRRHVYAIGESAAMAVYVAPRIGTQPREDHEFYQHALPFGWYLRHSKIYSRPAVLDQVASWILGISTT